VESSIRFYVLCSILILSFLITGCSSREAKCSIETLVLSGNIFPEGTFVGRLERGVHKEATESAYIHFSHGSNDVINWVDYWRSEKAAKQEFEDMLETVFDVDQYMGPWDTPKDLYTSSEADNYHVACGMVDKQYQCRLVATYKEYSVYLKVEVSDQWITLSKVDEMLRAIDKQMVECTQ
jgi:hypothetical protein